MVLAMTAEQVNAEMLGLRRRLSALLTRYDAGERSSLYPEMRVLTDEVVCLIDEAPDQKHEIIGRLAERCETFLRSLAN